ncbi:MAG: maleylpyruvate isomerase family mycothiol-dependent enzyme [Actinomycetota bacterium]
MATEARADTGYRYVDKDAALTALKAEIPVLLSTLRAVKNPQAIAVGHWTTRDVAAHFLDQFENYRNIALGNGSPYTATDQIAGHNDRRIKEIDESDMKVLADQIEAATVPYLEALSSIEGDPSVPWAGIEVPVSTLIGFGILECQMHGYDIATAEGGTYEIDPARAALALKAISPATMHYVDPRAAAGLRATYDIRVRDHWQMDFIFDDGTLRIEEPSGRKADVHLSADPVAFALVGYGRAGQWGPAIKGQIVTWGRKPWLAFKFAKLLKNP